MLLATALPPLARVFGEGVVCDPCYSTATSGKDVWRGGSMCLLLQHQHLWQGCLERGSMCSLLQHCHLSEACKERGSMCTLIKHYHLWQGCFERMKYVLLNTALPPLTRDSVVCAPLY